MTSTSTLLVLKELAGNEPTSLNMMQRLLEPHLDILILFWFSVWCATLVFVIRHALNEYRAQKRGGL